ncbi:MAG TPA: hypothetical protein VI583_01655 [Cyclobacteriaceae bacterium]|nr:hypothetical protein [Cyclobacteriaceae bacterium]
MKIAIPTNDGHSITTNTKFLKGFKTFEIMDGKVMKESYITDLNRLSTEITEEIRTGYNGNALLSAIDDCKIVISNGLDKKLFEDLLKAHKEVYITESSEIRIAIRRFVQQTLKNHPELCS